MTTQLDIMQAKQKQAEVEQNLVIFFPRCRKKHSHKECMLDMVQTYAICTKYHATEHCPSLLGLKAVYKEAEEETEPVYLLNQHRQWKQRQIGTPTEPSSSFQPSQYNAQQYTGTMWKNQTLIPIGHDNHSLCHLGPTNQTKIIVDQIFLVFHHFGHPLRHKTRVGSQAGNDLQISQQEQSPYLNLHCQHPIHCNRTFIPTYDHSSQPNPTRTPTIDRSNLCKILKDPSQKLS